MARRSMMPGNAAPDCSSALQPPTAARRCSWGGEPGAAARSCSARLLQSASAPWRCFPTSLLPATAWSSSSHRLRCGAGVALRLEARHLAMTMAHPPLRASRRCSTCASTRSRRLCVGSRARASSRWETPSARRSPTCRPCSRRRRPASSIDTPSSMALIWRCV